MAARMQQRWRNALQALAAACALAPLASPAATVAYYQWENGTAGERAHGKGSLLDSSGNGLNGDPSGGLRYASSDNPGSTLALHFNGRDGRVWIKDNPLFELTHSLTLEAYLYISDFRHGGIVLIRSDSRYDIDPYYLLLVGDGILQFSVQGPGLGSYIRTPDPLPLNQWVHVAGTLDDATGQQALYVNGTLVASTTTAARPRQKLKRSLHAGIGIGAAIEGSPDQYYFKGSIDDVRISDVALDPSQFLPPP